MIDRVEAHFFVIPLWTQSEQRLDDVGQHHGARYRHGDRNTHGFDLLNPERLSDHTREVRA